MTFSMSTVTATDRSDVGTAIETTVRGLVRSKKIGLSYYVNLPMIYPDGSFVTIRIDSGTRGAIRVSDAGFAFREADEMGYARTFTRTANALAETVGVRVEDKTIVSDATIVSLDRAICDVAEASWRVAAAFGDKFEEEDDFALTDELSARLKLVFGPDHVSDLPNIIGSSTVAWPVTAVVSLNEHRTVFQAVAAHSNSLYRTATAFKDIAAMENAPRLVAVVRNKSAFGAKISLLSPGRVIEETQPDDLYRRAAA
jgi:hypothetical protein